MPTSVSCIVNCSDRLHTEDRYVPMIDYCNSLLLNRPATQTNRLQLVLIGLLCCRAVTKTHKFHHITRILKSLHWLKINERIKYKVLSHIIVSKLVNILTSAIFFQSLHIVVIGLLLLLPLVALTSYLSS